MNRATFFGIEIGKTGLYVSQKGLDVTAHNISNVDTAGYTRQRLTNTAYDPYNGLSLLKPLTTGLVGSGAKIMVLEQVRSAFLDRQFRTEQTAYSYWEVRGQGLTYVESLFESVSGELAMTEAIQDLFTAFNTVSNDPANKEERTVLKQQAVKLCEQFNHMYDSLIDLQKGQNTAVKTVASRINTIAEQIANLNKAIYAYEIDGDPANDLRDKRNLLIDELAAIADIEYTGDAIGSKCEIKLAGQTLVSHKNYNTLSTRPADNVLAGEASVWEVYWTKSGDALNLDKLTGGELLAHIRMRDSDVQSHPGIPYFIKQLNALAQSVVQLINEIHRDGWTHPASGEASHQGVNFFNEDLVPIYKQKLDASGAPEFDIDGNPVYEQELDGGGNPVFDADGNPVYVIEGYAHDVSGVTAGNIRISDELEDDVFNIAASSVQIVLDSSDETLLQVGNNENMLALFALKDATTLTLNVSGGSVSIGSFGSFINAITLDVATSLEFSKHKSQTSYSLLLSADTQRTSVAGVSLDEEMTQLIKYNHAFSGASRVITAMDEALDTLINKMGRVGL